MASLRLASTWADSDLISWKIAVWLGLGLCRNITKFWFLKYSCHRPYLLESIFADDFHFVFHLGESALDVSKSRVNFASNCLNLLFCLLEFLGWSLFCCSELNLVWLFQIEAGHCELVFRPFKVKVQVWVELPCTWKCPSFSCSSAAQPHQTHSITFDTSKCPKWNVSLLQIHTVGWWGWWREVLTVRPTVHYCPVVLSPHNDSSIGPPPPLLILWSKKSDFAPKQIQSWGQTNLLCSCSRKYCENYHTLNSDMSS